jgi:membrane fusion protein, multidrug efflux system
MQPNQFEINPQDHKSSFRKVKFTLIGVILLLIAGLMIHFFLKAQHQKQLVTRAETNSIVYVQTTKINKDANNFGITLPSTVQGINEAQIYARANGYVKKWYKDIGTNVKKGDLLAELDIPEVEKQVEEASTNYELAKKAYERWKNLLEQDAVSQQEFDEKLNAFRQTDAVLKRLQKQFEFREVRAPFDGIITKRNINVGDLVNSGNSGVASSLFSISQNKQLKLYAYVPQNMSDLVTVGTPVEVSLNENPDAKIKAKVSKIASAVDTSTRTMQVEILLPEKTSLLPGLYVEVNFKLRNDHRIVIPTKTLLFAVNGINVAVVNNGVVQLKKVVLGIDYGQNVEIKSGISPEDEIILNPPDSIQDGQKVVVQNSSENKSVK